MMEIYWGYMRMAEQKMETATYSILGLYRVILDFRCVEVKGFTIQFFFLGFTSTVGFRSLGFRVQGRFQDGFGFRPLRGI